MLHRKNLKYICAKCKRLIDTNQIDVEGAELVVEQTKEAELHWHRFCKQVSQ